MKTLLPLAALTLALGALSLPSTARADDFVIDGSHTHVGFKVRHMAVSWVRGEFGKVEGTVSYDPKDVSKTTANVTIDVTSIDTRNQKRDDHLRSPDFFDVATHPKMTFVSTGVRNVGKDGSFELVGTLTMRGKGKEVALKVAPFSGEVADPWGNVKRGTEASVTINRQDWGVNWSKTNEVGELVVGDDVTIELEIELNKK